MGRLASFNFSEGPNQVSREKGKRRVVVTAEVRGRDIGSVVNETQEKVKQQVTLPAGYWLAWGGQFENFEAASWQAVQAQLFSSQPVVHL